MTYANVPKDEDDDGVELIKIINVKEEKDNVQLIMKCSTNASPSSHVSIWIVSLLAALSGFLGGYDLCVIVIVLSSITSEFELNLAQKQSVISLLMAGAVIGSLLAGPLSDGLGRKKAMGYTTLGFVFGTLLMILSPSVIILQISRFIMGMSIGSSLPIVSMYVAEMATPGNRGRLVVLNELMLCTGCLVSIAMNTVLDVLLDTSSSSDNTLSPCNWRMIMAVVLLPALIQLCSLPYLLESPAWLERISHQSWKKQLKSQSILLKQSSVARKAWITSVLLAFFHAASGASALLYYSQDILQAVKVQHVIQTETTLAATKASGVLLAVCIVDKVGRRPLLLIGSGCMMLCLVTMSIVLYKIPYPSDPTTSISYWKTNAIVLLLHVFIFCWNISFAPLMYLVCAELLPLKIRSIGMATTMAVYWLTCAWVNQILLSLFTIIGLSSTLLLFAISCFGAWLFFLCSLPETSDRIL